MEHSANNKRVRLFGIIGFLGLVLIGIPLTVFFAQQQQTLQQSAHTPQPSVSAVCNNGSVNVSYNYILTDLPSGVTANITVTDSQKFLTDSFKILTNNGSHTKSVDTKQATLSAGIVTFLTKASDGFQKTDQKAYPATGPCIAPTPTATPSATPTLMPTFTPTPTASPTPTLTPTPLPTATPTLTPFPTNTPTPGPTATPTLTPTPTPTTPPGAPTNTPAPIVHTVVTPTLLPTGPADVIGFGIVGAILAAGGLLLIFAL